MIQIVREYQVKEEGRGQFELAYGPGGAWSRLFARAPGYRGAALLRDLEDPCKYLAIDIWDSEEHHQDFRKQHPDDYAALAAAFSQFVESEVTLGAYRLLAEATVRPIPGSRKGGAGRPGRGR